LVVPADLGLVTTVIYSPMLRFNLDGLMFFIVPKKSYSERDNQTGKWISPYIFPPLPPAPPAAAAAAAALPRRARSAEFAQRLPAEERDALVPEMLAVDPQPDVEYSLVDRHYLYLDIATQREVGELFLKPRLEAAERLDYEFALRMQGLQNTTVNAVWMCSDSSGAQPEDRAEMMDQFLRTYLSRFLNKVPQTTNEDPEDVIREAVQMHQQFCSGWVREHKRSLSPVLEATAEAMVGLFWDGALKHAIRPDMTWKEMSRVIRRDPKLSPQFGVCLNFYMVKLEQDRGSRNASYKSMHNANTSNMLSINAMDAFFRKESRHLAALTADLGEHGDRRFNVKSMDWYSIVSQLPLPKMVWTGLKKSRLANPGPALPWARNYLVRPVDARGGN